VKIRAIRGKKDKGAFRGRDHLQRVILHHHRRRHGSPPHPRPRLPGSGVPGRSFDKLRTGLAHELTLRGIRFEQFKKLPVYYKGVLVGDYEADFVIEDKIIPSTSSGQRLEIKAVSQLHPKHEAQAINYPSTTLRTGLTATGFRLAILLNPSTALRACFGADSLQHQRIVK